MRERNIVSQPSPRISKATVSPKASGSRGKGDDKDKDKKR
jgi:hypothetical protein